MLYIAKPDYLNELCEELGSVSAIHGNLVFSSVEKNDICFALDVWKNPIVAEFSSISAAANILRAAGKWWHLNPIETIRRSRLIEEQLRKTPNLQRDFPIKDPLPEVGCFSLLDKHTLVYSTDRWKQWPLGHCQFIQDKANPPNRAYLKLWEALTLHGTLPKSGDHALDLGAAPGGWTYVMQSLGTHITAVDKASLDPSIARLPRVSYLNQSAFALVPAEQQRPIDWLLSDIACYPDRLYDLVMKWISSTKAKQLIFTIKLQGKTDLAIIEKFKAIPNSRVIHLFHNKHEATFFWPASKHLFPFNQGSQDD